MPTYVHGPEADLWHWCKNCPDYPTDITASQRLPGATPPPATGVLCEQCQSMADGGDCESDD